MSSERVLASKGASAQRSTEDRVGKCMFGQRRMIVVGVGEDVRG